MVTGDGELLALDAKMNFDDNALYRHDNVRALRDRDEEEPAEERGRAARLELYQAGRLDWLHGQRRGLAMATMDIIHLYGGAPANFLDVGGGANAERVSAAFKIILSDPNVKGILVNIFGGICNVM